MRGTTGRQPRRTSGDQHDPDGHARPGGPSEPSATPDADGASETPSPRNGGLLPAFETAQLSESEDRYRSVVDSLAEGVIIYDADLKVVFNNRSAERILGLTPSELIGRAGADQRWIRLHEDGTPFGPDEYPSAVTLRTGEPCDNVLMGVPRPDGTVAWVSATTRPLARPGEPHPYAVVASFVDMTERKETAERLATSERFLRAVLDATPSCVYVKDGEGRFVLANPALAALYDRSVDEIVGKTQPELGVPAAATTPRLDEDRQAIESGSSLRVEHEVEFASGRKTWFDTFKVPVELPGGKRGVLGVSRDITERRQAEERIATNERFLRAVFDTDPNSIYVKDEAGRYVLVNAALAARYGKTVEEILGKSQAELGVNPEAADESLKEDAHVIATGEPARAERQVIFPTGVAAWFDVHKAPIALAGGRPGVLGVARDVTQQRLAEEGRRESEQNYRRLVEQLPLVSYSYGFANERLMQWYVSPQFQRLLGLPAEFARDITWNRWLKHVHPDDLERVIEAGTRLEAGEAPYAVEYRVVRPDGSSLWVRDEAIIDDGREPGERIVQGFLLDISARKQAEERLRESEEQYRQLVEQLPLVTFVQQLDNEMTLTYTSPQSDSLLHISVSEAEEQWVARIHPEDRQQYQESYAAFAERVRHSVAGDPWRMEYRITGDDGVTRWVRSDTTVVQSDASGPYVLGFILDVTREHEAEVELLRANERFQIAASAVAGLVYDWDSATGRIWVAAGAAERFGLHADGVEVTGDWWNERIHPEDREREHAATSEAIARSGSYATEYRFRGANGDYLEVWDNGRMVGDAEGHATRVVGTMVDVTERNEAQRRLAEAEIRYRTLVEQIPAYISKLDGAGSLIYLSPIAAQQLGIREEDWRSDPAIWARLLHPDDRDAVLAAKARSAEIGAPFDTEYRIIRLDGRTLWIRDSGVVLEGPERERSLIQGVLVDITERKLMETALSEANEKLTNWVSELERRGREMKLLSEMSELLQACRDADEAHRVISPFAEQLFPTGSGSLAMITDSGDRAETVASWDVPGAVNSFPPEECWALRRGRVHLVQDTRSGLLCKHLPDPPPAAYLCAPLMAKGEALGVLSISQPVSGILTAAKEQIAVAVAENLSLSLANLKLRETLRMQSIRDPLTGLFNRRYMEESIEREMSRVARGHASLSVAMLDIDHFKQFNDTFGHEAGDILLKELGALLESKLRAEDIACRYGGEEFLLIFPDASLQHAAKRSEEIREAVKRLRVDHHRRPIGNITVSVGVAAYPNHGLLSREIIRAADGALYVAKRRGRDRVTIADDPQVAEASA